MASTKGVAVGDVFEASIEKIAHGGHFIARHEGAVFFDMQSRGKSVVLWLHPRDHLLIVPM